MTIGLANYLIYNILPKVFIDNQTENMLKFGIFLIDDIVDSGGTLVNAAEALLAQGAKDVTAYITHGVLSGGAVSRITNSKLKELVITDSIQPTEAVKVARNIRCLPIASLIGEAIGRTNREESVSSLFE
jgi:ribose-phosphate pyrophosphokinase